MKKRNFAYFLFAFWLCSGLFAWGEVITVEPNNLTLIAIQDKSTLKSKLETTQKKETLFAKIKKDHHLQFMTKWSYVDLMERCNKKEDNGLARPFMRIRTYGKLHEHLDYRVDVRADVQHDNSKRNGSILNNAYLSSDIIPHHKICLGQMRTPVGYEGSMSPEYLDLINRSLISRKFGNDRDIGVKVDGEHEFVDYKMGIFNGQGYNADEKNSKKDYISWVVFKPFARLDEDKYGSLKLGAGYANGNRQTQDGKNHNHDTYSYYADYEYEKFGIRGEYSKKDGYGFSFDKKANGWYISTDYFLTNKIQAVLRYDMLTPDKFSSDDIKEYTIGLNYFIKGKNLRLQCNYVHTEQSRKPKGEKILFLMQYLVDIF